MSHPAVELPDAELLLTGWARDRFSHRTVTELPRNLEDVLPVVQVTRVGGGRVQQMLDRPRLDIDVFASSREQARDITNEIETALPMLRGVTRDGGTVGHVGIEIGASWRPDWNERVKRYGLTVVLIIRSA